MHSFSSTHHISWLPSWGQIQEQKMLGSNNRYVSQPSCKLEEKIFIRGGRLTLIRSTLSNLPIYLLSVFNIPTSVVNTLESIQCNFLWVDDVNNNRKIHLVNWKDIKKPLKNGGLGLRSIITLNRALLGKWI